jgi:hypothetical protein
LGTANVAQGRDRQARRMRKGRLNRLRGGSGQAKKIFEGNAGEGRLAAVPWSRTGPVSPPRPALRAVIARRSAAAGPMARHPGRFCTDSSRDSTSLRDRPARRRTLYAPFLRR